jgi:hypothetical protein
MAREHDKDSRIERASGIGRARGVAEVEADASLSQVGMLAVTAAIADALRAGAITPAQAKEQLVQDVVAEQYGSAASAEDVARVRAEVEALLEDDPTLGALLRG